jgi:hypothetical protein
MDEILKKLGADDATIEAVNKGEKTVDDVVSAFEAAKIEQAKELVKNDADFRKSIIDPEVNKVIGTLDNDIKKRFGLKPEDLAGKKLHEKLDLLKEAFEEAKRGSGKGSEEAQQLQQALADAQAELDKYKNEVIPGVQAQAQKQLEGYAIAQQFTGAWDAIPADKVLIDKGTAKTVIEVYIEKHFDARLVNGKLEYFQKGSDLRPQFGNEIVKESGVLIERVLSELKLNKVHNGGSHAVAGGAQKPPNNGKPINPLVEENKRKIQEMTERAASRK